MRVGGGAVYPFAAGCVDLSSRFIDGRGCISALINVVKTVESAGGSNVFRCVLSSGSFARFTFLFTTIHRVLEKVNPTPGLAGLGGVLI